MQNPSVHIIIEHSVIVMVLIWKCEKIEFEKSFFPFIAIYGISQFELTLGGSTSIVMTYDTGMSPIEAVNIVNDNP